MTTIVYRAGIVAADSLAVRGDMAAPEKVEKLWRTASGGVAAITGTYAFAESARSWIDFGKKDWEKPKFDSDTRIIEFLTDGRILEHDADGMGRTTPLEDYYAWGSGRDFAYGALAAGATARQAVEIAAKFDLMTGGEFREMRVRLESDDGC